MFDYVEMYLLVSEKEEVSLGYRIITTRDDEVCYYDFTGEKTWTRWCEGKLRAKSCGLMWKTQDEIDGKIEVKELRWGIPEEESLIRDLFKQVQRFYELKRREYY